MNPPNHKSHYPGITYINALEQADQDKKVLEELDNYLDVHKRNADACIFAVKKYLNLGKKKKALDVLNSIREKASEIQWNLHRARLYEKELDQQKALECWRKVSRRNPLNVESADRVFDILNTAGGEGMAWEFLNGLCAKHSKHGPLLELKINKLKANGKSGLVDEISDYLKVNSSSGWAWRELLIAYKDLGNKSKALGLVSKCKEVDPESTWTYSVIGWLYVKYGEYQKAQSSFEKSILLSVDNEAAVDGLMAAVHEVESKKRALGFVHKEIINQVIDGDVLLGFEDHARVFMSFEEIESLLTEAHEHRSDLWQSWSALVHLYRGNKNYDKALQFAKRMCEKFPLTPVSWRTLSWVYLDMGNRREEEHALHKALEINPIWEVALRDLAANQSSQGDLDEALSIYQKIVRLEPYNAVNYGNVASVLWKLNSRDEAVSILEKGCKLDLEYDWGWDKLVEWSRECGGEAEVVAIIDTITSKDSPSVAAWVRKGEVYAGFEKNEEALTFYDQAIALDPERSTAYDLKAVLLSNLGRHDEALECLSPKQFASGELPQNLKGRKAWLVAQSGDLDGAIKIAEDVVLNEPDYYWCVQNLVSWNFDIENYEKSFSFAKELIRINPDSSSAYGHCGRCLMEMGNRDEAKKYLSEIWKRNPDYGYAGRTLFDMHFEDKEYPDAEKVLEILGKHHPEPDTELRKVEYYSQTKNKDAALEAYRNLCFSREGDEYLFVHAYKALKKRGWSSDLSSVEEEALFSGKLNNPSIAENWGSGHISKNGSNRLEEMEVLEIKREIKAYAWKGGLGRLARIKKFTQLKSYLEQYRDVLFEHAESFGVTTYLCTAKKIDIVASNYFKGYRSIEGVQFWMGYNLAALLDEEGDPKKGAEVRKYFLDNAANDGYENDLKVMYGAYLASENQLIEARKYLFETKEEELEQTSFIFHHLGKAVLFACDEKGPIKSSVYHQLKQLPALLEDYTFSQANEVLKKNLLSLISGKFSSLRLWYYRVRIWKKGLSWPWWVIAIIIYFVLKFIF